MPEYRGMGIFSIHHHKAPILGYGQEITMRTLIQGKLYKLGMDLNINNINFYKGALVVYVEQDRRYANSHWVLLPNGQRGSVWSGHLEVTCK